MSDSPFRVISQRVAFQNRWFSLFEDKLDKPVNGSDSYAWMDAGEGVAIVALDANEQLTLIQEYRYATQKILWCVPAGGIDKGESPLVAAKRELAEEVSLQAKTWTSLGIFHPAPGYYRHTCHMFLAQDLSEKIITHTEVEQITIHTKPFAEALDMVWSGEITDAWAIVPLLKAAHVLKHL